jgi:CRISPR/Cas system-associated exonuclease Cas4 (RecB family)
MFIYCPPKELPKLESETLGNGKRYYVTPSGKRLPSVTTVVGATKAHIIQEWRARVGEEEANRISRQASSRGNNLHSICEQYLMNNIEWYKGVMPDALDMFKSIRPHINKIQNIHYQEEALWSEQLGLAGRVDCIAEFDDKLSVIDFKTSSRPKKEEDIDNYFWQTTAYALMYEELVGTPIDQLVIIMAVKDSEPLVFKQRTEDHIEGLVKAIEFYKNMSN